jgi:hypothetical protein
MQYRKLFVYFVLLGKRMFRGASFSGKRTFTHTRSQNHEHSQETNLGDLWLVSFWVDGVGTVPKIYENSFSLIFFLTSAKNVCFATFKFLNIFRWSVIPWRAFVSFHFVLRIDLFFRLFPIKNLDIFTWLKASQFWMCFKKTETFWLLNARASAPKWAKQIGSGSSSSGPSIVRVHTNTHTQNSNHLYVSLFFPPFALQPQFGPWPTSMKLSVSLRFSRS